MKIGIRIHSDWFQMMIIKVFLSNDGFLPKVVRSQA